MKKKITKDKVLRAAFSLLLAVFLWAIASSDDGPSITSKYSNIPLEYINLSENLIVDSIDKSVDVKLSGSNLQMNKVRRTELKAVVDLSNIKSEGSYTVEVNIYGMPDNVTVSEVSVKYVMVVVSNITSSHYNIKVETTGSVPSGYILLDTDYETDSVRITGSENKTSEIDIIKGELDVSNFTSDFSVQVDLKAYNSLGKIIDDITIEPSSITVDGEVGITKKVEITPQFKGECTDGFKVKSYSCEPATITIGGKKADLDGISAISTEQIDLSGKSASFQQTANLEGNSKYVIVSDKKVAVFVEIVGYSVKTFTVDTLQIHNEPHNCSVDKSAFSQVDITVTGFSDEIEALGAGDIKVYIDLNGLTEGTHSVDLGVTLPEGIALQNQSVNSIDVVITPN